MRVNVILGCNIRIYREGVLAELNKHSNFEVLTCPTEVDDIILSLKHQHVDTLLLDLGMKGVLELLPKVHSHNHNCKIIALSFSNSLEQTVACAKAGVAGFVSCNNTLEDLMQCLYSVMQGRRYLAKGMAETMLDALQGADQPQSREAPSSAHLEKLTCQQTKVLNLLEQGCSNKQIAKYLHIEVATVKNHVHNILQKLNVDSRGEAAAYCRQMSSVKAPAAIRSISLS